MTQFDIKLILNSAVKGKRQKDIWSVEIQYYFAQWVPKLWHYLLLRTENINNFKELFYY